jgi:hypothetical protein
MSHQCPASLKSLGHSWAWWPTPVILALRKLREEDHKFKGSLATNQKILFQSFIQFSLYLIIFNNFYYPCILHFCKYVYILIKSCIDAWTSLAYSTALHNNVIFLFFFGDSAGDQTHGLAHTRQVGRCSTTELHPKPLNIVISPSVSWYKKTGTYKRTSEWRDGIVGGGEQTD